MIPLLLSLVADPALAAEPQFLDETTAPALCAAWNQSALPLILGRSGSHWIDAAGDPGSQRVSLGRRDCDDWPLLALEIQADGNGDARCVAGGLAAGERAQWVLTPTTAQWADFSDGLGILRLPALMRGFDGSFRVAFSERRSLAILFAVVGQMALDEGVDWRCAGAPNAQIGAAVGRIDPDRVRARAQ